MLPHSNDLIPRPLGAVAGCCQGSYAKKDHLLGVLQWTSLPRCPTNMGGMQNESSVRIYYTTPPIRLCPCSGTKSSAQLALINKFWLKFCSIKLGADFSELTRNILRGALLVGYHVGTVLLGKKTAILWQTLRSNFTCAGSCSATTGASPSPPPPFQFDVCLGHARLMEPPSRASMWRVGFDNPPDFNDNQGYCGGFMVRDTVTPARHFRCRNPHCSTKIKDTRVKV